MIVSGRRAKIIATLGPSCDSLEQIREMIEAGADVLRVNTSHLNPEEAQVLYERISQARGTSSTAILVDLQGPKIRLGEVPETHLDSGQEVSLSEKVGPNALHLPISGLCDHVQSGDQIVLGDGAPTLLVQEVKDDLVECRVQRAGDIRPRMGAALPHSDLCLPALTKKDHLHLQAAAPHADWVALSFVSCSEDVRELQYALKELGARAKTMVKIERAAALKCLDGIIQEADGVMVARGDLGVETGLASVPFIQEDIVKACIAQAKPAVIATQVMESMTHSDLPTRAEASDVAQALVEGASALMLSAETATGEHPVLAVETLGELIYKVEAHLKLQPIPVPPSAGLAGSLVRAADQLATDQAVQVMLIPTSSGRTARLAANLGRQYVVALCTDPVVRRQLSLEKGVKAIHWDGLHGDYLPVTVLEKARQEGVIKAKRRVVVAWSHEQPDGSTVQLVAALGS